MKKKKEKPVETEEKNFPSFCQVYKSKESS